MNSNVISHFYSDPHFGHSNIIKYANRPFRDRREMDRELIRRYNEVVKPDDTVLWCGDCSFKLHEFADIMAGLNGRKLLILGNHDKGAATMSKMGFDLVMDNALLHIEGREVYVNHYPYADAEHGGKGFDTRYADRRPKRRKGQALIHGHTHQHEPQLGTAIHVGVDSWDYKPATMAEVAELVRQI